MWNYGYGPMMGWGYGIGWLGMILFWIFVIVVIILIIRALRGPRRGGWYYDQDHWHRGDGDGGISEEDSALRILKERYARGEITEEEFETRKNKILRK